MLPTRKSFSSHLYCPVNCHSVAALLVFKYPLFHSIVAPKCKGGGAGNSYVSKRSCKVDSLSENMKVIDLIGKKTKSYTKVDEVYTKNESLTCAVVHKEKTILLVLVLQFKSAKCMVIACEKYLVKIEK